MKASKIVSSLLFRIIIAILLGIICSLFFPAWLTRIFLTFNGLFSGFLSFFVPVLIFALITPAIASLGKGAGKWLGVTAGIAYLSTVVSGALAYLLSVMLYPSLLANDGLISASDVDEGALTPYFTVDMPAPFEVMSALLLAFTIGIAMASIGAKSLLKGAVELRDAIMLVVERFVIPLLPIYIFGVFLGMGQNENLLGILGDFAKVLILASAMTWVVLLIQYIVAGAIAGRNPLTSLKNMLPAYFTALGTSSSAATIPVTLKSVKKNGVSNSVADFVVPLCATVHLSGSMMKIGLFAFAVVFMTNLEMSAGMAFGFIFLLGIMMVAAPGVPGGAIMAAVGLLESQLNFNGEQVALMIAAYIAIDSFGTACNVTGDGAIAMVVNKFAKGDLGGEQRPELAPEHVAESV